MKKITKMFLALVLMLGLSGCVKFNVNMEVKDDKSVTLEVINAMEIDDSFMDDSAEDTSDGDVESDSGVSVDDYHFLENRGFKVEEFTEEKDGSVLGGVKVTKTYGNIDDITKDSKVIVNFTELFNEDNSNFDDSAYFSKDGNNYVANFVFDFSSEVEDGVDYSTYESMFDLVYKIKLPTKVGKNNATNVSEDGKELTWDLNLSSVNEVNFEFALDSSSNILPAILGGLGLVLILAFGALLIIMILKHKKDDDVVKVESTIEPTTNEVTEAVEPVSEVVENPAVEPAAEVVKEPVVTPVENTEVTPVSEVVETPVVEPTSEIVQEPVVAPVENTEVAPASEVEQVNSVQ